MDIQSLARKLVEMRRDFSNVVRLSPPPLGLIETIQTMFMLSFFVSGALAGGLWKPWPFLFSLAAVVAMVWMRSGRERGVEKVFAPIVLLCFWVGGFYPAWIIRFLLS